MDAVEFNYDSDTSVEYGNICVCLLLITSPNRRDIHVI
jgi:hypothetical protein